ncbi:unnamed protein product [Amoebophrya sp. A25]|nr:unnamed protein product [Amoebophrya sp. A25]|eukprot:GSA25T00007567001.1
MNAAKRARSPDRSRSEAAGATPGSDTKVMASESRQPSSAASPGSMSTRDLAMLHYPEPNLSRLGNANPLPPRVSSSAPLTEVVASTPVIYSSASDASLLISKEQRQDIRTAKMQIVSPRLGAQPQQQKLSSVSWGAVSDKTISPVNSEIRTASPGSPRLRIVSPSLPTSSFVHPETATASKIVARMKSTAATAVPTNSSFPDRCDNNLHSNSKERASLMKPPTLFYAGGEEQHGVELSTISEVVLDSELSALNQKNGKKPEIPDLTEDEGSSHNGNSSGTTATVLPIFINDQENNQDTRDAKRSVARHGPTDSLVISGGDLLLQGGSPPGSGVNVDCSASRRSHDAMPQIPTPISSSASSSASAASAKSRASSANSSRSGSKQSKFVPKTRVIVQASRPGGPKTGGTTNTVVVKKQAAPLKAVATVAATTAVSTPLLASSHDACTTPPSTRSLSITQPKLHQKSATPSLRSLANSSQRSTSLLAASKRNKTAASTTTSKGPSTS